MSLVNELLEDFHRRRVTPNKNPKHPLAGVEVTPHDTFPHPRKRGSEPGPKIGLLPWLFGVAGLTILGFELLTGALPLATNRNPTPAVNARPPTFDATTATMVRTSALDAPGSAASNAVGKASSTLAELYDVEVQNSDGYTRLRFQITAEREYWLQGDPALGEIEVVITGTKLASAFSPYSFEGTGLQLQETHNTSTGLHLLLSFEPAARVQSQFVHDARGAALVLDVITAVAREESSDHEIVAFEQRRDAVAGIRAAAKATQEEERDWGAIQQTRRHEESRVPDAFHSLDRARALEARDRKPEAMAEYIRALALDPDLHSAREALVVLLVETGRNDAALRHLADGTARAPRHSEYNFLKAQVLVAAKQPDRAIAILESLPTPPDRRSDALNLLAALYQQKGNHARAEALFRDAVQLAPQQARLWMGLGISLEGQKRKTEALAVYKQAESLADFETGPRRWLRSRIRELSTVE